jgi:hypothetical protein
LVVVMSIVMFPGWFRRFCWVEGMPDKKEVYGF